MEQEDSLPCEDSEEHENLESSEGEEEIISEGNSSDTTLPSLNLAGIRWRDDRGVIGPIGQYLTLFSEEQVDGEWSREAYAAFKDYFIAFCTQDGNKLAEIMEEQNRTMPIYVLMEDSCAEESVIDLSFPFSSTATNITSEAGISVNVAGYIRQMLLEMRRENENEEEEQITDAPPDPMAGYFGGSQIDRVYCDGYAFLKSDTIYPLTRKRVVDLMSRSHEIDEDVINITLPHIPPAHEESGSFIALVDKDKINSRNVFHDEIGAHSGKVNGRRTGNNYNCFGFILINGSLIECPHGQEPTHSLRTYQFTPPHFQRLSKKSFLMVGPNGKPSHPLVVCWSFKSAGESFPGAKPHGNSKRKTQPYTRMRPDVREEASRLLATLSVKKVFHALKKEEHVISVDRIRSIAKGVVRVHGGSGRFPRSKLQELLLSACTVREGITVSQGTTTVEDRSPDGTKKNRTCASVYIMNREAAHFYLKQCARKPEIVEHQRRLDELSNDAERQEYLERCCLDSDRSGSFVVFGGGVMYDTTFSISDFYLSILYAECKQIRNRETQKTAYVCVSMLIHNSKRGEVHDAFFKWTSDHLQRMDQHAYCPFIVSDDESSFRKMTQHEFFAVAHHSLCDVHYLSNMKRRFGDQRASQLQPLFFGSKSECLSTGEVTLNYGLLHNWSLKAYQAALAKAKKEGKLTSDETSWFLTHAKETFLRHGLIGHLRSGFAVQFLSSNVIECLNRRIKSFLGHYSRSGPKLLEEMVEFSREELKDVRLAVELDTGYVELSKKLTIPYSHSTSDERDDIWKKYGLSPKIEVMANFRPAQPDIFFQGRSSRERSQFVDIVKTLEVDVIGKKCYVTAPDGKCSSVLFDDNSSTLNCVNPGCQSPYFFCKHKAAFFITLHDDQQMQVLERISQDNEYPCAPPLLLRGGQKQHRMGSQKSANPRSRRLNHIQTSSESDYPGKLAREIWEESARRADSSEEPAVEESTRTSIPLLRRHVGKENVQTLEDSQLQIVEEDGSDAEADEAPFPSLRSIVLPAIRPRRRESSVPDRYSPFNSPARKTVRRTTAASQQ